MASTSTQFGQGQRNRRQKSVGRFLVLIIAGLSLTAAGCGLNGQKVATQFVILTSEPTITIAPIVSMTPRFTATLIPTVTPIPSETLPASLTPTPFIPTTAPTATAIPAVRGTVRSTANFRTGPGRDFEAQDQLAQGTELTILSYNDTQEWFLVRLDDGRSGWVQANLIDTESEAVQVLPPPQLTAVALATLPPAPPTPVPTLTWRATRTGDILAYCDLPAFAATAGNKTV
ncbi:MAG: SH3 domain-containing protein, partial [Anaerolineae bacterium]